MILKKWSRKKPVNGLVYRLFGGDGGISAARITSAKPKIFRKAHIFGASGTHPVGSHPHHKTKKTPKMEPFCLAEMVGFEPTCPAKDKTISSVFISVYFR